MKISKILAATSFLFVILSSFVLSEISFAEDDVSEVYEKILALREDQKYVEAEKLARGALKEHPDNVHLVLALGDVLNFSGQHTEATKLYQNVLDNNPKMPEVRSALCSSLVTGGNFHDAIPPCEQAQRESTKDGTLWFNLGRAYAGLNELEKGRAQFQKYVNEFGGNNTNDRFVSEAKEEVNRLTLIINNRKGAGLKAQPIAGFSAEETELLNKIEKRYSEKGLPLDQIGLLMSTLRQTWLTVPSNQRKAIIQQTLDQLS